MSTAQSEYCLFMIDHWSTCMTKGEWSGWMQFVGTVIAVVIAAFTIWAAHQLELTRKRQAEQEECTRLLESLFQLVGGTRMVAEKIGVWAGTGGIVPADQRTMLAELRAFEIGYDRLEFSGLNSHANFLAWIVGGALTRKLIMEIEWMQRPDYSPTLEPNFLTELTAQVVATLDPHARRLHDEIEQRAGKPRADFLQRGLSMLAQVANVTHRML